MAIPQLLKPVDRPTAPGARTPSTGRPLKLKETDGFMASRPSNGASQQQRPQDNGSRSYTCDRLGIVQSKARGPGSCEVMPTKFPSTKFTVSAFQHMGDRKTQEDRYAMVPLIPQLDGVAGGSTSFFGVWDGTVGDFASENVRDLMVPTLLDSPYWAKLRQATRPAEEERVIEALSRDLYISVDNALLNRASQHAQHYATCTSVTCMMVGDLLAISHLGDSRIVMGKEADTGGKMEIIGEMLTNDHKPDLDSERARIESCGGMVERLQNHSNKPFIRGGDFLMRKALGEQPMQLQYSRAFGAKDLKIFGMSNNPDVKLIRMGSPGYRAVRVIILASDGLWDVLSAQDAVMEAMRAIKAGENPSEHVVMIALKEQARRKARADNVTAVCIVFD